MITGASGFIGSNLCDALLKQNYEVIRLDSFMDEINIKNHSKTFVGSFSDKKLLDKALKDVDYVFHLACTTIPQTSAENPVHDIQSNVVGVINLLEKCVEHNIKKFFYFSSGGTVYGLQKDGKIRENSLTNPVNFHGVMKLSIEKYLYVFNQIHNLDYLIFRPSNVYGTGYKFGKPQGVVNIYLKNIIKDKPILIWGDGGIVRDYIWVKDVIDAVMKAIKKNARNKIYNIGSGVGVSLIELVSIIENIIKKKANIIFEAKRSVDMPMNILDASLAQKELNWKIKVSLKEGIKLLYDSYAVAQD